MKTLVFLVLVFCLAGCTKSVDEKMKIVAMAAAVLPDSSLAKTSSEPEYVFRIALINKRPVNEKNWPRIWYDTVRIGLGNSRWESVGYIASTILPEIPINPGDSIVYEFRESDFSNNRWFFENNQDSVLCLKISVYTVNFNQRLKSKYRQAFVRGAEAKFIVPWPSRLPYSDSLSDSTAYQELKRK